MHWTAVSWSLLAIAGLALASPLDVLDHRPGGAAFEISERPIFMGMFVVGILLALKWEIVGGIVSGFTASGLMVFAYQQLKPTQALIVIVAFSVPAILWIVIDINDNSRGVAALGLLLAIAAVVAGAVVASNIYDDLFGPTHPTSSASALPESELDWIWSGAVSQDSFSVTARLDDDDAESVRLMVASLGDFSDGTAGPPVTTDDHDIARFTASGLDPDTLYHYAVEVDGEIDRTRAGTVRTFPAGPASFSVAIGSDARVGSNGAVFDEILSTEPLLYLVPGDLHYADIAKANVGQFEDVLDLTLTRTGPAALYRSAPVAYVWDDHDFGGDGSDGSTPSAAVAHEIYRRYVPHYPLAGPTAAIYQSFSIGRARFILTDGRSARSPVGMPDGLGKSMLGVDQLAWLKQEFLEASESHELIVWVNPLPWISEATPGADDWGGFATERAEIADFIADNEIGGLVMLSGDAHMLAIDDGTNSDFSTAGGAAFPIMHSAALDRPGSEKGGPYSEGTIPGGGHFGLLTVADDGGLSIEVSLSGRNWLGEELIAHRFTVESGR